MESQMLLSILIPVYNWDISTLVTRLHRQCMQLPNPQEVEIIIVDDGSISKYSNSSVTKQFSGVTYKELDQNQGRSVVRNCLIDIALGKYVLFLDADMLPDQKEFVETYSNLAKNGVEVVCGGLSYQQYDPPAGSDSFHVYKSMKTEALPAALRNKTPWRYIFTSNILIRRDILDTVRFDPRFTAYGFEDIEWGMRLNKSFEVTHIDNTCSHMGVMHKNKVFARMREAVENHFLFYTLYPSEVGSVGAIRFAKVLQHLPDSLLSALDTLLTLFFSYTSWNWFIYQLFQCDKVVLLARKFKERRVD